ncbi:MAG TPA: hypothetical protein VHP35_17500 [Terriglobia bacterium]|nr:hypothetical protein [Terriglobia bacterium]
MRVGSKGRRLKADGSRHSGRLPTNNLFTAIMALGATTRDEIGCAKLGYVIYRNQ